MLTIIGLIGYMRAEGNLEDKLHVTLRKVTKENREDIKIKIMEKTRDLSHKRRCWSTKHPSQERRKAYEKFFQTAEGSICDSFDQFLFDFEGLDTGIDMSKDTEVQTLIASLSMKEDDDQEEDHDQFLTEIGPINGIKTLEVLDDQSTRHRR
ncbi:hypothetical protein HI914_01021 [Erysiphe necator]|nr:hypothetical protein HI914_01021 [Erysiphe necator]